MKTRPALIATLAAVAAAVGCSGGSVTRYDGEGNGGSFGGATGGAAGTGTGGGSGTGTGGTGNVSGPACAVGERTPDITDCTEFANTAASVLSERAVYDGDAGIYLPGGELATPAGGTLIDGDYELIRAVWGTTPQHTQRTIRLFASGTYMEWVVDQDSTAAEADGGVIHYRINAAFTKSGNTLTVAQVNCGNLNGPYDYTASGDQLILFNYFADGYFVFKRTCVRR